ncbi:unnamed protein product (mitochondrion) [Plasmodiophora brassicae]|uniref:Phospholipid-transporting ATPase n=1 Tax=Plasmodiophora brassicae TaxID=37360 RepID=A0A0G4J0L7_PLABS|nr:hypothetical protein PBRA_008211 [Plasmodiophora brassicae]SPR01207.1 unnamed protein product [Plasmodiophora brassicae]
MDDGDAAPGDLAPPNAEPNVLSPPPSPAIGQASALSVPDLPSSLEFRREAKRQPTRAISVNDRLQNQQREYPSNVIRTSKYTPLTFLPINLFEQFRRISNFYFLIIICISIPPQFAPYPWYTTALPLIFILTISAAKDGYEDFLRHRDDSAANSRVFQQVQSAKGALVPIRSGDITVGDVIKIDEGQEFPADLIVLVTSKHDNTCYINTANLDGEVTPKLRVGVPLADPASPPNQEFDLAVLAGAKVESGEPCKQLDGFEGTLTMADGAQRPLGDRQVLLRGAKLRGTAHVYAVVFATGPETKLMLNRNPIRYKFSSFEKVLNKCVFASLIIEVVICTFMSIMWDTTSTMPGVNVLSTPDMRAYDVYGVQDQVTSGGGLFITSFILYSFLIPVSLFVTIDFVKIGQAMVIEMDTAMSVPGSASDVAEGIHRVYASVKSSNLNDELGMIEYLFTDKTGTLTCNRMELSNISTDGFVSPNRRLSGVQQQQQQQQAAPGASPSVEVPVGTGSAPVVPANEDSGRALNCLVEWAFQNFRNRFSSDDLTTIQQNRQPHQVQQHLHLTTSQAVFDALSTSKSVRIAQDMLFCMLVCNDILPERQGGAPDAPIAYSSTSPDEIALVEALRRNGMTLVSAGPSQPWVIQIDCAPGFTFTFRRIAQLDFSSDRRRMTVVVQVPDGTTMLFTKGASSTIAPMLSSDAANAALLAETEKHLTQFAKHGSRTLMMACRHLDAAQLLAFQATYDQARVQLQERERAIERAFRLVERDLTLLGATSVEDQLQEMVPETIEQLLNAGIKIMMLTGDMQETAVTIGRSSRIISRDSQLLLIQAETPKSCEFLMDRYIKKTSEMDARGGPLQKLALVLNGNSLELAIEHHPAKFLSLFARCETIICNRATPSQKAAVVELVTTRHPGVAMAIGDGANDVSMIRRAHVGVGLIGREGRQAAQSADFVLHKFAHLRRLLFVHGRFSFLRSTKVVLFSFYKNFAFPLPMFWFQFFSQFSGNSIYDGLIMSTFNMFFSSLPPLIAGVLETDATEVCLLKHPIAYKIFRSQPTFTVTIFLSWLMLGTVQSLIIYFAAHLIWAPTDGVLADGTGVVLDLWTFGTWMSTATIVTVNLTFLMETINLTVMTILFSFVGIVLYLLALWPYTELFPSIARNMYGQTPYIFTTPMSWVYQLLVLLTCVIPLMVINHLVRVYFPTYSTVLREFCSGKGSSTAPLGTIGCCLTDHIVNGELDLNRSHPGRRFPAVAPQPPQQQAQDGHRRNISSLDVPHRQQQSIGANRDREPNGKDAAPALDSIVELCNTNEDQKLKAEARPVEIRITKTDEPAMSAVLPNDQAIPSAMQAAVPAVTAPSEPPPAAAAANASQDATGDLADAVA